MSLESCLDKVKEKLASGGYDSEAAVSQGVLLPILRELGWPVDETSIVFPEYSLQGRRVDFALCHPEKKPKVFIEVKQVGQSEGADEQLFQYAFLAGVPMAVLTDGQEWGFYLPSGQGHYSERRVCLLDIAVRNIPEAAELFARYLSYQRVCDDDALEAAQQDYKSVSRVRLAENTIPKAWDWLLKHNDQVLVERLSSKVEELCGYKPELDACGKFLTAVVHNTGRGSVPVPKRTGATSSGERRRPRGTPKKEARARSYQFTLAGEHHEVKTRRDAMVGVLSFLAEQDGDFCERFVREQPQTKRRFLARSKKGLYPNAPHLAKFSARIAPGWWVGTNYNSAGWQQILTLALQVATPGVRAKVKVNI